MKVEDNDLLKKYSIATHGVDHQVFYLLDDYSFTYEKGFYQQMGFLDTSKLLFNINLSFFSSLGQALSSTRLLLSKKNMDIANSYLLLRRFQDLSIFNIYTMLLHEKEKGQMSHMDDYSYINRWVDSKIQSKYYDDCIKEIKKNKITRNAYELLNEKDFFNNLRKRCNNYSHFNSFSKLSSYDEYEKLDQIKEDTTALILQHLSYLFVIDGSYMMSSDYIDSLDCGYVPAERSEFWVSPWVQEFFDKIVKKKRIELFYLIKEKNSMYDLV